MSGEPQHLVDGIGPLSRGLQREPFVEHQRVVVETLVEGVERLLTLRCSSETSAPSAPWRSVILSAAVELRLCNDPPRAIVGGRKQAQGDRA